MTQYCLVADIGGTNARFALSPAPGEIVHLARYRTNEFDNIKQAILTYLSGADDAAEIVAAAIGAAGPVSGNEVILTNAAWTVSGPTVSAAIKGAPVKILNDVEAVAAGLPHIQEADLDPIRTRQSAPASGRLLVANVGTGFGAATASPLANNDWYLLSSEAGHMSAPYLPDHPELARIFPTVEDLLSGPGVVALYHHLGGEPHIDDAATVIARCQDNASAHETVDVLNRCLGQVVGDLVLASTAWGGAFLTGSVATALRRAGNTDNLLKTFDDKGPMRDRMRDVPIAVIAHDQPALFGLTFEAYSLVKKV